MDKLTTPSPQFKGSQPVAVAQRAPVLLFTVTVAILITNLFVGTTHPLAKSKFVSLNQIASEPVAALARKDYPHYHQHLEMMFATIGRKPRISSEHDSGTSLMAAVAAGQESTFLPSCVRAAAGRRLKLLKLRPALRPWSIVALWRKDAETESVLSDPRS
jgi:DNA-binding transcriptional LysR family regulator